jgi:hypothetical protein
MTNYSWIVSAGGLVTSGGTSTSSSVTVKWLTEGPQTVSVSFTNTTGCTTSPTVYPVVVSPLPAAVAGQPRSICIGSSTQIGAPPVPGSTYLWSSNPQGYTSTLANPVVSPTVSTVYTVVETVTETGCSNSHSVVVMIVPPPVPSLTGPTPVCNYSTGNVYVTDAGKSNYVWTIPSGATKTAGGESSDNTVTLTFTTAGTKVIKVSYTNEIGCTAVNPTSFNVVVKPSPVPTITGPSSVCDGVQATYSTSPWQFNYQWTLSPGGTIISGSGTKSVKVQWANPGANWIAVNFTTSNGCSAPSPTVKNVTVNDCKSNLLPGEILPESQILMLENEKDQFGPLDMVLFPNPNEGNFTIIVTVPEAGKYNMELFSNLGVKVYEVRDVQIDGRLRKTFHIGNVAEGVYNFILSNNKDQSIQKRVIIMKQH